jgi:hypothetical protein
MQTEAVAEDDVVEEDMELFSTKLHAILVSIT